MGNFPPPQRIKQIYLFKVCISGCFTYLLFPQLCFSVIIHAVIFANIKNCYKCSAVECFEFSTALIRGSDWPPLHGKSS